MLHRKLYPPVTTSFIVNHTYHSAKMNLTCSILFFPIHHFQKISSYNLKKIFNISERIKKAGSKIGSGSLFRFRLDPDPDPYITNRDPKTGFKKQQLNSPGVKGT